MERRQAFEIFVLSALLVITVLGAVITVMTSVQPVAAAECTNCCDEGYLDYYRCDGRDRQRLWQFSDCSREWRVVESCSYGCSDGSCISSSDRLVQVSPLKPDDVFEGATARGRVMIDNLGNDDVWVNMDAYLCEVDGGCTEMSCEDNYVYVQKGGREFVSCWEPVLDEGEYRIKVVFWFDDYGSRSTVYSEKFRVRIEGTSEDGEYRCFGKFRQQKYIDENADTKWKIVEYCPNGCEEGACLPYAEDQKFGEPKIFMPTQYDMERCDVSSFTFSVRNDGDAGTFEINVEGEAADWVEIKPEIEVGSGETKHIVGFATVPCDVKTGEHEFVVTVSGKTADSSVGVINIGPREGLFVTGLSDYLLLLVVIVIIFVLLVIFKDKIAPFLDRISRPKLGRGTEEPESFGEDDQ